MDYSFEMPYFCHDTWNFGRAVETVCTSGTKSMSLSYDNTERNRMYALLFSSRINGVSEEYSAITVDPRID